MEPSVAPPTNIDEYISRCPSKVRTILKKIRATIRKATPEAQEVISYRMPAFKLGSVLVYFAAWKDHIGFYPPVRGDAKLEKAVSIYQGEKGNLKFPLDRPVPYDLIEQIVKLRVQQHAKKTLAKRKQRSERS